MRKLSIKSDTSYALLANGDNKPTNVSYNIFGENLVQFSDGSSEKGTCLNCLNPPCTYYSKEEMTLQVLPEMPYNNNNRVCPTDAITLDERGFPAIKQDQCIGCGLCIARCPYGAIEWEGFKATVVKRASDKYTWVTNITSSQLSERHQTFLAVQSQPSFVSIPKDYFSQLYDATNALCRKVNGFDNHFTRNLLLNLGLKAKVRAVGNNDIRFDLLSEFDDMVVVGEIGLNGTDILEEPRAILDDFAILVSRYKIQKDKLIPLIITLAFPNKRSDVYEVILDIKKVLGFEIKTVPFHLLILLNLFHRKIAPQEFLSLFFINKNNTSAIEDALSVIPSLNSIDPLLNSPYYQAMK